MTLPSLDLMALRSVPARDGAAPLPTELALILQAATTVPDHGAMQPWRFIVVEGQVREHFGDALAAAVRETRPDAPEAVQEKARGKAFAAPCFIVIVASPDVSSNVPEWEQISSASCCGYAMVLAATALGLGAIWKTANAVNGSELRTLCQLDEDERLLGWVNVGSPASEFDPRRPNERQLLNLATVASMLGPNGIEPLPLST